MISQTVIGQSGENPLEEILKVERLQTSLIACMDSSTGIKKNLTNLSTFDIPSYKQCALNACALVRSQLPKECTFWTLEIMGLNYVEL